MLGTQAPCLGQLCLGFRLRCLAQLVQLFLALALALALAAVGSGADLPVRAVEAEVEVEVEVTRPTPLMTKRMTKRRHLPL